MSSGDRRPISPLDQQPSLLLLQRFLSVFIQLTVTIIKFKSQADQIALLLPNIRTNIASTLLLPLHVGAHPWSLSS